MGTRFRTLAGGMTSCRTEVQGTYHRGDESDSTAMPEGAPGAGPIDRVDAYRSCMCASIEPIHKPPDLLLLADSREPRDLAWACLLLCADVVRGPARRTVLHFFGH